MRSSGRSGSRGRSSAPSRCSGSRSRKAASTASWSGRSALRKKARLALAAGSATAAPGIVSAQAPAVSWRMAASWPKSLDAIYGGAEYIAKRVAEATGGKFNIKVFAAGEIVGGLQVLDAVQNGT